jgi:hypothetical protein
MARNNSGIGRILLLAVCVALALFIYRHVRGPGPESSHPIQNPPLREGKHRKKNADQNSSGVTNGAPGTENRFRHSVRRSALHAIPITLDNGTNLTTGRAPLEAATGTRSPILNARREGLHRLSRSHC